MRILALTLVALCLPMMAMGGDPESVRKSAGYTSLGGYEPAIPKSLEDIPAPVREKVVAHLKKRLGEDFYSSLRFSGGQVVDFDEFHRQVPDWKEFQWEVFAYKLFFQFRLPDRGIEYYEASIRLRADGSVIEEIDLPDMGKHPERAAFVPLSAAVKVAKDAGFDVGKCSVDIDYRPEDGCCVYSFVQRDHADESCTAFRGVEVDAHAGKLLRVIEQE